MNNLNLSKEIMAEYFGDDEQNFKKRSQIGEIWRRMRKNKTAVLGLVIIAIFAFLAIFAGIICEIGRASCRERV